MSKSVDGFAAVGGVSFTVPQGSISAIIGPNGAGKTTLFNLITGRLQPDGGRVVFKERDVTGIAPHDLCRLGMGRSFQRTNIFPRLTVFENVQAASVSHRRRGWRLLPPAGAGLTPPPQPPPPVRGRDSGHPPRRRPPGPFPRGIGLPLARRAEAARARYRAGPGAGDPPPRRAHRGHVGRRDPRVHRPHRAAPPRAAPPPRSEDTTCEI